MLGKISINTFTQLYFLGNKNRIFVLEAHHSSLQQNPLLAPQREKAGANTYAKFEYQYHWALCRILDEHENSTNYAVFIELHEDVVVSSSTDQVLAQFELNQIKNLDSIPLNAKKLTTRAKGREKNLKNSTLGKMLLGIKEKPFLEKIHSLNLVATCGFNLVLKKEGVKLSIIKTGDIHADCLNEIQEAINNELGSYPLPENLTFIQPDLQSQGFQEAAIGRISKLINKLNPNVLHNPQSIYTLLMDDLRRKGTITFDYTEWNTLVKKKGMTYEDVESTISQHIQRKDLEKLYTEVESIAQELGWKYHKKVLLKQNLGRYYNEIRFNRTLKNLSNQKAIEAAVSASIPIFQTKGVLSFLEAALEAVPANDKVNFTDDQYLTAGILYELINSNHGQ